MTLGSHGLYRQPISDLGRAIETFKDLITQRAPIFSLGAVLR